MTEALIRPKKLYEEVVVRISDAINSDQWEPGDRLPSERELMEQFGVGRPAVREALFALQRMGLVEVRSGTRARVTKPTPQRLINELSGAAIQFLVDEMGVRHFQDARLFFEVGLARYAATHATPEDVGKLEQALLANKRTIGDLKEFARTDVDFHFVLPLISRNPIFIAIHEALVEWLTEQRTTALQSPDEDRIAYAAHEAIFKAIAKHDPDRAERAMKAHLAQVSEVYWRARKRRQRARSKRA